MILRSTIAGLSAVFLFFAPSALSVSPSDLDPETPVSQILSLASAALSSGSSQDALAYYDIAITRDPSNYLSLFKRGATQLSLGRSAQALADFDKVLTIKPGLDSALLQRAKIRARAADWQKAKADYLSAGRTNESEEIKALEEAEGAAQLAKDAGKKKNWEECVGQAGIALMTAAGALDLRQLRARCRLEKGEILEAVGDLQHVLQINPSATEPAMQISAMMFYSMGESSKGVDAVKRCLHSDPDSKSCKRLFKREKKLEKQLKKAEELLQNKKFSNVVKMLGPLDDEPGLIQEVKDDIKEYRNTGFISPKAPEELLIKLLDMVCTSFVEMSSHKRGAPYCSELHAKSPGALSGVLHTAQSLLDADDFEAAVRILSDARQHHQSQGLDSLLQKAQTLLKRSKTKDYYKTLNVDRDSSPKEIKRAYLKLSKQHHPDKASSPEARPAAEAKMAQINEAYEVLSDPELKARFDNGDDPNDPTSGHGQGGFPGGHPGGHPFAQFFGQGGSGGQQQFVFQHGSPGGGGGGQKRQPKREQGGMPNFGGMPFGGGGAGGQGGFKFPF